MRSQGRPGPRPVGGEATEILVLSGFRLAVASGDIHSGLVPTAGQRGTETCRGVDGARHGVRRFEQSLDP